MMTLLFLLVSGLAAYGISSAVKSSDIAYRNQLALPPPPPTNLVPATLSLHFSATANGSTTRTEVTVFFELNQPRSSCSPEDLQFVRDELQALGGEAMITWSTNAPYTNPTQELREQFQGIQSRIVPLSRVIVSDIRGIPPALKPLELPAPSISPSEAAINELEVAQFHAAELRAALIESQKRYPELWEDEDTRAILENRFNYLLAAILRGGPSREPYRDFRTGRRVL
jgi:hypothetical protein